MRIEIEVKDEAGPFLTALFSKQLPFATALAINETAKDFQAYQRTRLHELFTIRRPQFANQSVKIKPFATKDSLFARVAIESPGDRDDIFGKFETERKKEPISGQHVAVPVEARRTKVGIVQARDRPRRVIDDGRAFVRSINGRSFIFERLKNRAAKKAGRAIRLLYTLVRSVPIKPNLGFHETARKAVARQWGPNFRKAFDRAIRTAR